MEDMEDEIFRTRQEKANKNTQEFFDKFKDEIESHGATAELIVLAGNRYNINIKGTIPDDLTVRINEWHSKFYRFDNLG